MKSVLWILALCSIGTPSTVPVSSIEGTYWNPDHTGKIEIFAREGRIHGRILDRDRDVKDVHNPVLHLRSRSVIGIEFLRDFEKTGDNVWSGGTIYSFRNGKTYQGRLWLEGNDLMLRGFMGVSILGKTVRLERVRSGP